MSQKKLSKSEASKEIEEFFTKIGEKSSKEVKKIKRMAMKHNIKLGEKRKMFCNKCLSHYKKPKIRIKDKKKTMVCENCNSISRWKIK